MHADDHVDLAPCGSIIYHTNPIFEARIPINRWSLCWALTREILVADNLRNRLVSTRLSVPLLVVHAACPGRLILNRAMMKLPES